MMLNKNSVIYQGPSRARKVRQLPEGYGFIESGPRDTIPGVRIVEHATGRVFERQHEIPWADEEQAMREFNDSARFRKPDGQPR